MSRLGTFSTDEGLGSEPPEHDQSFDGIAQYNELEEEPVSVQKRREEPEGDSTRRAESSSYPYTPNYPYPGTVQERRLAMWRPGEPPLSSSTPTPIPPPFLPGTRAMITSSYSQDSSFEASTDAPSSSYPYNDLGRRVADLQRRTMVSLSDIMGEGRDEDINESAHFSHLLAPAGPVPVSVPGPGSSGVTRTTGATTADRSHPNPFLTQETEPRIHSNLRIRQIVEERRDMYRDEDIGMELDRLTAPASFLRRRKSMDSDDDDDYGGSVLHKEARLDPSSFKASGEHEGAGLFSRAALPSTNDLIDELRRETGVQLITPDELERRMWMYEDSGRIGKIQRLGLWKH
ncbi:hypothetical protein BGZ82_006526 [Podila clonocystis]|nr:hypothetical protein BGZ82_006526 [Podila clonocystis]